jgi:hypothetical protein
MILPRLSFGTVEDITATALTVNQGIYSTSLKLSSAVDGKYTASFVYAIPEPTTWAMLIMGFGIIGGALRVRARKVGFDAGVRIGCS